MQDGDLILKDRLHSSIVEYEVGRMAAFLGRAMASSRSRCSDFSSSSWCFIS